MLSAMRRLRAFFRRDRLDDDLAEEIRLHLELRRQALVDAGVAAGDADREARRQFGNVTLIRERTRDQWGGSSIDMLVHDVRYGLRLIRKAPGFSAVAIASLAIGIGASTVLFSFANAFLFRPVHAARPEQLVALFTSDFDGPPHFYGGSSYPDYETFRQLPVFDGVLASARATATLSDQERPDVIGGLFVSGNYFDVLGLHPSRGRFFRAEEDQAPGTQPVVVLSDDAWRRRFATDPAIVGRVIELNGQPFTVIGVGPRGFAGTSIEYGADFFVPAMMQPLISPGTDLLRNRRARSFRIFGRLRSEVTLREADSALRVVAAQLLQHDPAAWRDRTGRGRVITVLPEIAARFADAGPGSVMFIFSGVIAGVVALLAIACVNVATVLLARATTRRKEIAVRLAMGASRRRVVRQLLTECALLAAAGGALGLLIARFAAELFTRLRPSEMPPFDLTLDYRILLFSMGASLLTVMFFGLAPALQTTRPDLNAELKDTARTVRVRGFRFGLRAGLVVIQVALSLALMIGSALMLRSAHAGRTGDPGFRRAGVLSVGINVSTVPDRGAARARFYQDAVRSVAALPGVERAALAALVPMDGSNSQVTFRIADRQSSISTSPDINVVGAGYFALLDIPVKQGREFNAADRGSSPPVAVVNETMARQFWNGDAVGRVLTDEETGEHVQIVGAVRDLRHRSFDEAPVPMVYLCADQRFRPRMTLHVRTAVPPRVIGPVLQRVLHEIDHAAGLAPAETMTEYFDRVTLPQRLGATAAMATAALELALVVMALYGVIAFAAEQRRREIGLRMALGASNRSVIALMMREGLLLSAVGVVLGVGVALMGGAALRSMLIGIGPADPVSFGSAALVLLTVGAAASYVPSRRALSVDPSTALRSE
jgi:putative ABC transport system permease protein